jgi:hypothetical protein
MATLIGFRVMNIQASNLAKTNSTLADTDLVLPIAAGESMSGFFYAAFSLAGAASGAKFQLTVPAGGTLFQLSHKIFDPSTPAVIFDIDTSSAPFSNALANINDYFVEGSFVVRNGVTAGNITLQFAQLVTDAAAATFLAGAYMVGFKNN